LLHCDKEKLLRVVRRMREESSSQQKRREEEVQLTEVSGD
jgi:hypothetical protein